MSSSNEYNHSPQSDGARILRAVLLMGSTTAAAIVFSVVTNKLLSVIRGPEGVAIMGVLRNLASFVSGTVALGYGTVIVEKMANAKTEKTSRSVLASAFILYLLQVLVGAVLVLFFSKKLASYSFGEQLRVDGVFLTVVALGMSLLNLGAQTLTCILKGAGSLRSIAYVQAATSLSSLALIFPLLKMGNLGLAINVGSGSIFGIATAIYLMGKHFSLRFTWADFVSGWEQLKKTTLPSLLVTLQTFLVLGGLLSVQTAISSRLGLEDLGNYNAAWMVLDTGILVLMSSLRSFLLPSLGREEDESRRSRMFERMFSVQIVLASLAAIILMFGARWIVPILFSGKFRAANGLLAIFSLALIGQTLCWLFNTLLLYRGKYLHIFFLDAFYIVLYVVFAKYLLRTSLENVGWAYVVTSALAGVAYLFAALKTVGANYFTSRVKLLFASCTLWVVIGFRLYVLDNAAISVFYLALTGITCVLFARRFLPGNLRHGIRSKINRYLTAS